MRDPRNRLVLMLSHFTGMWVVEMAALKIADIVEAGNKHLLIVHLQVPVGFVFSASSSPRTNSRWTLRAIESIGF